MLDAIQQDLKYALRSLWRAPAFTLVATFTLAVVIAANTAVLSIVDTVLLRPLSYNEPDRLVVVHDTVPHLGRVPVSAGEFEVWTRSTKSFESLALLAFTPVVVTGRGEPERLDAARVSPALFSMLRATPASGRLLAPGDDVAGRDRVVVLSDGLWRRRFGADPSIVGRGITVNGAPYTVVGILPRGFRFPRMDHLLALPIASGRPDLWLPFAIGPADREENSFVSVARLAPGVTVQQARTEMNGIQKMLGDRLTPRLELGADVLSMRDQITGPARQNLAFLWAAMVVVLVIAVANVANLLLARAWRRRREIAVRAAIGASRGRIVRHVLIEAVAIAILASVCGVAIAYGALPALVARAPASLPRLDEVAIDGRILALASALTLVLGLAIGAIPGIRLSRGNAADVIRTHAATEPRHDRRTRRLLVAAQVALTVVTVTAATLIIQSLLNVLAVNPGFAPKGLITVGVSLAGPRYAAREARTEFTQAALDALRALPGVSAVGAINKLPLEGVAMNSIIAAAGTEEAPIPMQERPLGDIRSVNREYFSTLGIPVIRGRLFAESDGERDVAVVSAAMAARTWPGVDPIGRRFRLSLDGSRLFEVVGVAGNVRAMGLDVNPPLTVYLPYSRGFLNGLAFAIKTTGTAAALAPAVRRALHRIDPELAVSSPRPMTDAVSDTVAPRRFEATVLVSFAGVSLLLAGVGVYAVLALAVTDRTRELGVRAALGAAPFVLRRLVMRNALGTVAIGISAGIPAALATAVAARSLLFGVEPQDPTLLAGGALIVTLVALLASYLPARRAARVDPMVALKTE